MTTPFQQLSDSMAEAVAHAAHSIVRVEARRRLPATGIVWSDEYVITAHHVVEKTENITLGLPNGTTVEAALVGRDANTDLAILRAKTGLKPFAQAERAPRVGELVLAIGMPGQQVQASLGLISAHLTMRQDTAYQTGVTMYPGFSGGPLIDASAKLLGMNTSAGNGGLTLSLDTLRRIAAQLTQHGKMKRGYIGLGLQPVRLNDSLQALAGQKTGLLVVSIEQGGPADSAGLFQGDIVVAFDGHKTASLDELLALLDGARVGRPAPVQVLRGGQAHTLTITVAERD
ncbi:MAG: S1C family serine protease [Anaerolineae bacterium]|jgi:S1-C subfamily serine protease|nr:S1C family serine protease [Anaerolineae bacterium]